MEMKNIKKNWWKILLLTCFFGFINMLMHAVLSPANITNINQGESSIFVKTNTFMLTVIVWEIIAFSTFTIIFIYIQQFIPANRYMKGFLYGFSFAGIYLIGMFESELADKKNKSKKLHTELETKRFILGLTDE